MKIDRADGEKRQARRHAHRQQHDPHGEHQRRGGRLGHFDPIAIVRWNEDRDSCSATPAGDVDHEEHDDPDRVDEVPIPGDERHAGAMGRA